MANTDKAKLILHPVRLRIIQTLAGRALTAGQIAAALPDVAQATLYRHLGTLVKGGVLTIAAEHSVRGTVEKVYALAAPDAGHLGAEDAARLAPDEHFRLFTAFLCTLLGDFARYIQTPGADLAADSVGYHQYALYLDDAEMQAFLAELSRLLLPLTQHLPGAGRRRRLLNLILLPGTDHQTNDSP